MFTLADTFEAAIDDFDPAKFVDDLMAKANYLFESAFDGDASGGVFDTLVKAFEDFPWAKLGDAFWGLMKLQGKVAKILVKLLYKVWRGVFQFGTHLPVYAANAMYTILKAGFKALEPKIGEAAVGLHDGIRDAFMGAFDSIGTNLTEFGSSLKYFFTDMVLAPIQQFFTDLGNQTGTFVDDRLIGPFGEFIAYLAGLGGVVAEKIQAGIIDPIEDMGDRLREAGVGIFKNIEDGLKERFSIFKDGFTEHMQGIRDLLTGSEPADKTSPWVELPDAGKGFWEQLEVGLQDEGVFGKWFAADLDDSNWAAVRSDSQ